MTGQVQRRRTPKVLFTSVPARKESIGIDNIFHVILPAFKAAIYVLIMYITENRRSQLMFSADNCFSERLPDRHKCAKINSVSTQTAITADQSFFAVFCIEALADELNITGDRVYGMLTENSDILDNYIVPSYEALHTQGKNFIVRELVELMQTRGVLSPDSKQ